VIAMQQTYENITQYEYQWNEKQLSIIDEYRIYFYESLMTLEDMNKKGPDGIQFPKKPKGNLCQLLVEKEEKTIMSAFELNDLLEKQIVTDQDMFSTILQVTLVSPNYLNSLETLKPYLQSGYKTLTKLNKKTLASNLDFGEMLNVAFELFEVQKLVKMTGTWKDWVLTNIGISERYERELREMSRILAKHKKFRKLGMTLDELRKIKTAIEFHLKTNPWFSNLWQ
jgi:hypothetical protein